MSVTLAQPPVTVTDPDPRLYPGYVKATAEYFISLGATPAFLIAEGFPEIALAMDTLKASGR